jgi:predicted transglutaminase-like cysteine proteinase
MIVFIMLFCFSSTYAGGSSLARLAELAKERYGDDAYQTVIALDETISSVRNGSELDKLKVVNEFFNRNIDFVNDYYIYKQADYWATPLETMGARAGDCEDFSIAKYTFLKMLNIDNNKLRLTYVRAKLSDGSVQAHMVLTYYPTAYADPLVLDNLKPQILPASQRPDLSPIFSFNDQGLWVGGASQPKSGSQQHLSKWRDVLTRIHADGLE